MAKLKVWTLGPIVERAETKTEAKEKCMLRASHILHEVEAAREMLPIRGIGEIDCVFIVPGCDGIGYGYIRDSDGPGEPSRIIADCISLLSAAAWSAIRHVADLYMGSPYSSARTIRSGNLWIENACRAWGLGDAVGLQEEIADMRTKRREMLKTK